MYACGIIEGTCNIRVNLESQQVSSKDLLIKLTVKTKTCCKRHLQYTHREVMEFKRSLGGVRWGNEEAYEGGGRHTDEDCHPTFQL